MKQPPVDPQFSADAGPAGVADSPDAIDPTAAVVKSQFLSPEEEIILMIRPSRLFIILSALPAIGIVVSLAILYLLIDNQFSLHLLTHREVTTLAGTAITICLVWQFFAWLSRLYVLTDRRILRVKGVLQTQLFEASLDALADPQILTRLRERITGLGTIAFGETDAKYFQAYWQMVKYPDQIRDQIQKAINRHRQS